MKKILALALAAMLVVGDRIVLEGRMQSRIYTKLTEEGAQERTTYEVSAMTAEFPLPEDLQQEYIE